MAAHEKIDWSQCVLVEVNPRVQSGAPLLRGTRIPVNAIVDNFDYGLNVAEISEQFEVPQDRVQAIWLTRRVTPLRILFYHHVPVGVRRAEGCRQVSVLFLVSPQQRQGNQRKPSIQQR